ncbi:glutathione S-transferase family protein [Phenylobacterium sp. 20VBR1]|uniref:Glutathione S-transferase family protein n=1 Tax=Phenylobacterium glaciei TaxID=2803784 RepID=A0A941D0Y0_9CAUL|nr:glutathione S-transferase family protein [Phenylobacterium glaciei]MBR7619344.1 glutathione S-transferase family protein [Phenylobacterium glaciei]
MKLLFSPPSPYARKVRICAQELGIALEEIVVGANPAAAAADPVLAAANPLAKIPTLVLDDGRAIYDSAVIVDYLDSLTDRALAPRSGDARWAALVEQAAADGILDAALLSRYELFLRPKALRWPEWVEGQSGKIERALDLFEGSVRDAANPGLGDICVACALGYLDLRFPNNGWRTTHPKLTACFTEISERPSLKSTVPA